MAITVEAAKDMYLTMTETEREAMGVAAIRLLANWGEQNECEEESDELTALQEEAEQLAQELDDAADPAFAAQAEAEPAAPPSA